jgi:hypothetical protein
MSWFERWHVRQILSSAAVAAVIAPALTWCTNEKIEQDKRYEEAREQRQVFATLLTTRLLNDTELFTEKGTSTEKRASPEARREEDEEARTEADAAQQQASVTLLALEGLAENEEEQRALLLVAARLLNANPRFPDTGGPAARFLDMDIESIVDRKGNPPWWGGEAERTDLTNFVRSDAFVDLVTSGFALSYYNYARGSQQVASMEGDHRIDTISKVRLLSLIGKQDSDGWVNLASWRTPEELIPRDPNFARSVQLIFDRASRRDKSLVGDGIDDYISPPKLAWNLLLDRIPPPTTFMLMEPRLLRENAPTTAILDDGSLEGILGRVTGIVNALECVSVVEPTRPVVVFAAEGEGMVPVIHLWAHVHQSDCSAQSAQSE